jgi:pimeloyl-ACP methyl ester carboxylesterase
MNYRPDTTETTVRMGIIEVEGLNIFFREAGTPGNPKLVLLHGFPASSHQYRNLIRARADQFHVIAVDYRGFGNSDMPDPTTHLYTFDKTSEVVEAFLQKKDFISGPVRQRWRIQRDRRCWYDGGG